MNSVVSVALDERTVDATDGTDIMFELNRIPGFPLLNPFDTYCGFPVPDTAVAFRPLPDLSFQAVTVFPSVVIIVSASYASNHNWSWGRVEGRNVSPDTSEIARVIVVLSAASYHTIGPDERGPV